MTPTSSISRRRFLRNGSFLAATAGLPRWLARELEAATPAPGPRSANDKPNIALVGCGGMGRGDLRNAANFGTVTGLCDVDENRLADTRKAFPQAKAYADFRKLMEQKDVDVIINATPDHWHTLVNFAALKAGKDIYSEKPLTLTIEEGQRLVTLTRETKRILQTGSQQRSDARFRLACELVRNGRIGQLKHIITGLPAGPRGGPFHSQPIPSGLDWDFWLGQTPRVAYLKERCHSTFRYWYEYSGGTMTDWGAHHNDIALWGLGLERSGPVTVHGRPLVPAIPGGYTAASHYEINYTYANGVTHTCVSIASDGPDGQPMTKKPGEGSHGIRFNGTQGWIFVTRGNLEASDPELLTQPLPASAQKLYVSNNHMGNFFECVRTRTQPICDVEIGHRSVSVCHLGVISMRLGRPLKWNPAQEKFVNDREANTWLRREMRKPYTYDYV